jgi:hypothetical protein
MLILGLFSIPLGKNVLLTWGGIWLCYVGDEVAVPYLLTPNSILLGYLTHYYLDFNQGRHIDGHAV